MDQEKPGAERPSNLKIVLAMILVFAFMSLANPWTWFWPITQVQRLLTSE